MPKQKLSINDVFHLFSCLLSISKVMCDRNGLTFSWDNWRQLKSLQWLFCWGKMCWFERKQALIFNAKYENYLITCGKYDDKGNNHHHHRKRWEAMFKQTIYDKLQWGRKNQTNSPWTDVQLTIIEWEMMMKWREKGNALYVIWYCELGCS